MIFKSRSFCETFHEHKELFVYNKNKKEWKTNKNVDIYSTNSLFVYVALLFNFNCTQFVHKTTCKHYFHSAVGHVSFSKKSHESIWRALIAALHAHLSVSLYTKRIIFLHISLMNYGHFFAFWSKDFLCFFFKYNFWKLLSFLDFFTI